MDFRILYEMYNKDIYLLVLSLEQLKFDFLKNLNIIDKGLFSAIDNVYCFSWYQLIVDWGDINIRIIKFKKIELINPFE